MFALMKTLVTGSAARAEEAARDHFAVDLLEQKAREAEAALACAKETLASIVLRQRNETRLRDDLRSRIADLEARTVKAMDAGADRLAQDGASAIAEMENELAARTATVDKLEERAGRMRLSVEKMNRRVISLKQGMIQARAADVEHKSQKRLNRTISQSAAIKEAEELLDTILKRDDPLEESAVLDEIDDALSHDGITQAMAESGFGDKTKSSADDVLARLRNRT
jgi:phage shock protein A